MTIESGLNLIADLSAVRIASVDQQFPRPLPSRIQISQLRLELSLLNIDVVLPRQQDAVHVRPADHARGNCQQKPQPGPSVAICQSDLLDLSLNNKRPPPARGEGGP